MKPTTLEIDMNIRKNAKATAFYAAAETATLIADFALDMLAAAHRTGMDTMTLTYETLRANTIARIIEASDAMDIIGKPEAKTHTLRATTRSWKPHGHPWRLWHRDPDNIQSSPQSTQPKPA
jgi:hypothetical protein